MTCASSSRVRAPVTRSTAFSSRWLTATAVFFCSRVFFTSLRPNITPKIAFTSMANARAAVAAMPMLRNPPFPRTRRAPGRGRYRARASSTERRHDVPGEAGELLDHQISRRAQRPADHDLLQPGVPLLDLLQVGDDVSGRPAEPRAVANAVFKGGGGRRLRLPCGHRRHELFAVPQHAQRRHELGVLLEVRARSLDGSIDGFVDAHPEAEDQVLAES